MLGRADLLWPQCDLHRRRALDQGHVAHLTHDLCRCVDVSLSTEAWTRALRGSMSRCRCAAVRGVLQTFLGIWLFGDQVGTGRAAGIIFILGGSTYYVYAKSQEGAAGASKPPPQSSLSLPTHTGGAAAAAGGGGGGAPSPRVNQELFNADGSNGSGNEKDKNARVF